MTTKSKIEFSSSNLMKFTFAELWTILVGGSGFYAVCFKESITYIGLSGASDKLNSCISTGKKCKKIEVRFLLCRLRTT